VLAQGPELELVRGPERVLEPVLVLGLEPE